MAKPVDGNNKKIAAIVLAAGLSSRMGRQKLLLTWGKGTVIESVIRVLMRSKLSQIILVTGKNHEEISRLVVNTGCVELAFNPDYPNGEMLLSLKIGISKIKDDIAAFLIVLGDQPQISIETVKKLIDEFGVSEANIIIPSFNHRRGHPWLVGKKLWNMIEKIEPPLTLRDFVENNKDEISYVDVETETILQDLDTPDDYKKYLPALKQ